MIFTSHIFLFYFLPLVLLGYYALPQRARTPWLLVSSYVFYGWANPWYVLLIASSTCIDYVCGRALAATTSRARRRAALWTSIVANLSLLATFKYANFFVENLNVALTAAGGAEWSFVELVLPVGISFYTFQSMSYTIDLYFRRVDPAPSLWHFAAYVALFPQLVAGPIVRYRDLARQMVSRVHGIERASRGVGLFCLGLGKKVLLADPLGRLADTAFLIDRPTLLVAWLGIAAFGLQIYFDFSGYSDMAIGLGRLFGFELPLNFRSPYRSASITEFWRRWHLSLSSWLRDYLYIPLGGNRKGARRTYVNLAATMLLGGLWHGAAWTFVIWGALHGLYLAIERRLGEKNPLRSLPHAVQLGVTLVLTHVAWVFFRAESLGAALRYVASMFGLRAAGAGAPVAGVELVEPYALLLIVVAGVLSVTRLRSDHVFERLDDSAARDTQHSTAASPMSTWAAGGALLVFVVCLLELARGAQTPFLYFQF